MHDDTERQVMGGLRDFRCLHAIVSDHEGLGEKIVRSGERGGLWPAL